MRYYVFPLLTAACCVTLAGAQDGQKEARAVVAKAIEAHGGEAYLEKYNAAIMETKGHLEIMDGIDFTQKLRFQVPDKFRDDMQFEVAGMQFRSTTIYNAGKASLEVNGKKVDLGDKLDKVLKDATGLLEASKLVALRKKPYELSIVGEEKVNDQPAVGVRITKAGQPDVVLYFDKKTALIAKMQHRTRDLMSDEEVTEDRIITEYQKVDGVPQPKRVILNRDGKKYLEAEVVEVKAYEKLDDGEFKLP